MTKVQHPTAAKDVSCVYISSAIHGAAGKGPRLKYVDLVGGDFGILNEVHCCGERCDAAADEVCVDLHWVSDLMAVVVCVWHFVSWCFW